MKGLKMFLAPLFALPLLVGCKIGGLEDTHALRFDDASEGCYMTIDGEPKDAIITNQKVKAKFVPVDGNVYDYPIAIKLTVSGTEEKYTGKYEYESTTGELSIKMISDVTITATASPKNN